MDRMLDCSNLWSTEYAFYSSPRVRKPLYLRLIFLAALSKSNLINICPLTEFVLTMITRCCIIYFLHKTHKYTLQGLDLSESKTPMIGFCIHLNTHAGNKSLSMNCNQEHFVILAIVTILLYL
jgi:hypothetical protein